MLSSNRSDTFRIPFPPEITLSCKMIYNMPTNHLRRHSPWPVTSKNTLPPLHLARSSQPCLTRVHEVEQDPYGPLTLRDNLSRLRDGATDTGFKSRHLIYNVDVVTSSDVRRRQTLAKHNLAVFVPYSLATIRWLSSCWIENKSEKILNGFHCYHRYDCTWHNIRHNNK